MHLLFLLLSYHRDQQNAIKFAQRFVGVLPGRVAIDRAVWNRCFSGRYFTAYLLIAGFFILGLVAAAISGLPDGLVWLLTSTMLSVFVVQGLIDAFALAKAQCDKGNLVPARVVQTTPYLIAVYSDVSQAQDGSWPAVRIVKQPLELARGPRLRVGDNVVALARYTGLTKRMKWERFEPVAVQCVTDDQSVIDLAAERLSAASDHLSWSALDRYLPDVKRLDRPGFHLLRRPEKTNWLRLLHRGDASRK